MKQIKIRRILLFSVAFFLLSLTAAAQGQKGHKPDRKQWYKEMRQAKNDYVVKYLDLDQDQAEKFLPVYNKMNDELDKLRRETNDIRVNIERKKDASDLEYEKAAETLVEEKGREADIEKKYYNQFKKILKPQQLFKLPTAEMAWMKKLMSHRKNHKNRK